MLFLSLSERHTHTPAHSLSHTHTLSLTHTHIYTHTLWICPIVYLDRGGRIGLDGTELQPHVLLFVYSGMVGKAPSLSASCHSTNKKEHGKEEEGGGAGEASAKESTVEGDELEDMLDEAGHNTTCAICRFMTVGDHTQEFDHGPIACKAGLWGLWREERTHGHSRKARLAK